jgi:DNA gyrase subunit A
MVNLLPLPSETSTTVLPLPRDEAEWGGLHHVRHRQGHGSRNSMDAFTNIPTAGKIAMKFGTAKRRWR